MVQRNSRLNSVSYELQGPLYEKAIALEAAGHQVLKLNLGNPAPFGFEAPKPLLEALIDSLPQAQGYSDYRGILSAREAILQYYQQRGVSSLKTDHIFIGNGVSDLVLQAVEALLNEGDEVLVPSPDYPLWTAAVHLHGGKAVHYICDEASDWQPALDDIRRKINHRTRALVLINPNNPTGAVYSPQVLQELVALAEEHQLVIFSDEIYDKILYDGTEHAPTARFVAKTLIVTFSGLSKNYLAAGFRAGWMVVSGQMHTAAAYLEGLNLLAALRVCSNVPAQHAIAAALQNQEQMQALVLPTGRLGQQRDLCYKKLVAIPGISCVKPKGAFYLFPKLDTARFGITSDLQFALDFLEQEHVLLVQGSGFNWHAPDHVRIVYLPAAEVLVQTMEKLAHFLGSYRQRKAR